MSARSKQREQFLADIIIAAVEGGTGYWASVSDYDWDCAPAKTKATLWTSPEPDGPLIADDDVGYKLTIETIASGIAKIKEPGFGINSGLRSTILAADAENEAIDIDAELADCIVQAALFGKLVYG